MHKIDLCDMLYGLYNSEGILPDDGSVIRAITVCETFLWMLGFC